MNKVWKSAWSHLQAALPLVALLHIVPSEGCVLAEADGVISHWKSTIYEHFPEETRGFPAGQKQRIAIARALARRPKARFSLSNRCGFTDLGDNNDL